MGEDFRMQITREDIQEAIAALEQEEVHAFGPSTTTIFLKAGGDTRLRQSSALLRDACLAARSVLKSFREAKSHGRFDCCATAASTSSRN